MHLLLGPPSLSVPFSFVIPEINGVGNKVTRIGVYCSGGLDSAALLCLILTELRNTDKLESMPVTAFTVLKNEGSTYYSSRVVEKVSAHFNIPVHHVNNLENNVISRAVGRIGMVPYKVTHARNKHDMEIYQGNNRMAPASIRPFKQVLKVQYTDEQVLWKSPFLNLHKPQIIDLFYKLGCEDIMPYTHSCTVQAIDKCNNCYSCSEKAWAFNALGKEYIDTIPPDIDDISFDGTWTNNSHHSEGNL
jgi:7-cyano-7-deazaguanine synthase in queuosine biosynthesis